MDIHTSPMTIYLRCEGSGPVLDHLAAALVACVQNYGATASVCFLRVTGCSTLLLTLG